VIAWWYYASAFSLIQNSPPHRVIRARSFRVGGENSTLHPLPLSLRFLVPEKIMSLGRAESSSKKRDIFSLWGTKAFELAS